MRSQEHSPPAPPRTVESGPTSVTVADDRVPALATGRRHVSLPKPGGVGSFDRSDGTATVRYRSHNPPDDEPWFAS